MSAATCLACGSTRDTSEEQRLADLVAELCRTLAVRDRQTDQLREQVTELAATRDALAALVYRNGGDVTLTTYDLQRSPTGRDLEFVYMPAHDEYRLRLKGRPADEPPGPCVKCSASPPIGHQEPHRDARGRLTR